MKEFQASLDEQETVLTKMRGDDGWIVDSSDRMEITRLVKAGAVEVTEPQSAPYRRFRLRHVIYRQKEYKQSEAQRAAAAEALRKARMVTETEAAGENDPENG